MLEEHAEELGVVERDGKLRIPAFVWAFVFGFAAAKAEHSQPFDGAMTAPPTRRSPGGFYQRLTPLLAEFLRDLVDAALDEVAVPHTVSDEFDRFRDIIVADGTILRLHEFRAKEF